MNWARAHWWVGILTLAAFLLAGGYMRYVAHVSDLEDAPRLVYRSRFLFLLLIAVANLALASSPPKRWAQRLASAVILAAPVGIGFAFFLDPSRGVHGSSLTVFTMRALFVAGALLAFAHRPGSDR
jgi:phosphatidylglycerophosphate synthase